MQNSISIIIKPTNACNIRCRHCYYASVGYENDILPIENVYKIIDLATAKYEFINIMFHGGEPLCVPIDYYENIIAYTKSAKMSNKRFKWMIQTNAIAINDLWASFFKANHFSVGTSFDGPYNDVLRQKTDEAFAGIKLLQRYNVHIASIATLTNETLGKIIEIYEFFKKENLNFKFGYVFKSGAAEKNDFLCVEENQKIEALIKLFKYWVYDLKCNIICGDMVQLTNLLLNRSINL